MRDRSTVANDLLMAEQALKDLEIRYEQYFAGVEKREPVKQREDLAVILRRLSNRHLVQTDLRFRLQGLATRFHSYCGYWDRILRLMDEGRFLRAGTSAATRNKVSPPPIQTPAQDESARIHQLLIEAHRSCNLKESLPDRARVAAFLEQQREKIRQKFGEREIEFLVMIESGKPKIKIRAKE